MISTAQKEKFDGALQTAWVTAKKAGEDERYKNDLGLVVSATLAATVKRNNAENDPNQGGFDTTQFKPYRDLLANKDLDPRAKDALANDMRILNLRAAKPIPKISQEAADKQAVETGKAWLVQWAGRGGTPDNLKDEIERHMGDAPSYVKNELYKYADSVAGLDKNDSLKGALAIITKGTDEATRPRVIRDFLAEIGGLYQKDGETSLYRDPKTGAFNIDKVTSLAQNVVDTGRSSAVNKLLTPRLAQASEGEAKQYLLEATKGTFAGRFSFDNVSAAQPYAMVLLDNLKKTMTPAHLADESPNYDLYGEVGTPEWRDVDGGIWRPSVSSNTLTGGGRQETIVWTKTGGSKGTANERPWEQKK